MGLEQSNHAARQISEEEKKMEPTGQLPQLALPRPSPPVSADRRCGEQPASDATRAERNAHAAGLSPPHRRGRVILAGCGPPTCAPGFPFL